MSDVTIKLEGFKEAMSQCDPKVVRQAARASIDRATRAGRTVVSEEIRAFWNVKKADLDPRIKISPPRMDELKGVLTISGKGMSLSYFGARQITGGMTRTRAGKEIKTGKVTRGMLKAGPLAQGIMVQIRKGQETALLRNAFLAKVTAGKSGSHVGVFHRTSKKRLPIEEKNVISIASMAGRPEVMERTTARIEERWAAEFPRQLAYYQSKASK